MLSVETDYPVALTSVDHLHPRGTKQDNTTCSAFVEAFADPVWSTYLDLGCAGGGLVKQFHEAGKLAVGIEGSDYGRVNQFAEWATIPELLFTADITKPFRVMKDGQPLRFRLVTAWEVLEHIQEESVPQLLSSIREHLEAGGYFLGSISKMSDNVNNVEYHCTQREPEWWDLEFRKADMVPERAMYLSVEPRWPRGVTGGPSFPVAYRAI